MAVISFLGKDGWFIANWTFRRLINDVQTRFPISQEIKARFEQAQAMGGLHFKNMSPLIRVKVMRILKDTIKDILAQSEDAMGEMTNDEYLSYKNTLLELLNYINKYENFEWPTMQDS